MRHKAWSDGSFFPVINRLAAAQLEPGATLLWSVDAECSGGVVVGAILTVVILGVMDRRIVNREPSIAMKCGDKQ